MYTYIHTHTHTHIHIHIQIHMHIHMHIHTYLHCYIHAYMHCYIHTYIHTYIHALRCVALRCVALHCITLLYFTLLYIHTCSPPPHTIYMFPLFSSSIFSCVSALRILPFPACQLLFCTGLPPLRNRCSQFFDKFYEGVEKILIKEFKR